MRFLKGSKNETIVKPETKEDFQEIFELKKTIKNLKNGRVSKDDKSVIKKFKNYVKK